MSPPADDIDRIMAVMTDGFDPFYREAWTRSQVENALLMGNCHYAILAADGGATGPGHAPAGFFLSRHAADEEELLLISVLPQYRGRGLGARLLALFIEQAAARDTTRLFLEMRENNPAGALYAAAGFEPIGRRRDYYRFQSGEKVDAITLAYDLTGKQ